MNVKGIVWVGSATKNYERPLPSSRRRWGFRRSTSRTTSRSCASRAANGSRSSALATRTSREFDTGPVVEFLVDDLEEARAELESQGRRVPHREPRLGRLPLDAISAAPTATSTASPAARTGTDRAAVTHLQAERPVLVAMTGATGAVYGIRVLEMLARPRGRGASRS